MRVRHPDKNVNIIVKDNLGKVITYFKKDTVTPGSMLVLLVPISLLQDNLENINISITRG